MVVSSFSDWFVLVYQKYAVCARVNRNFVQKMYPDTGKNFYILLFRFFRIITF